MTDEAFVEQQRSQVVVAKEADAVHLVALALHVARRAVKSHQGTDARIRFLDAGFHANTPEMPRRVEVPDDVEARAALGPVHRRDVEEHVEAETLLERLDDRHEIR